MHRIRLDAAWEWIGLQRDGSAVEAESNRADEIRAGRIQLPVTLRAGDVAAGLQRVFHRPSGLERGERLQLGFAALPPETQIELNGKPLRRTGAAPMVAYWLPADELQENNRISLTFPRPLSADCLWTIGPVWLEILA